MECYRMSLSYPFICRMFARCLFSREILAVVGDLGVLIYVARHMREDPTTTQEMKIYVMKMFASKQLLSYMQKKTVRDPMWRIVIDPSVWFSLKLIMVLPSIQRKIGKNWVLRMHRSCLDPPEHDSWVRSVIILIQFREILPPLHQGFWVVFMLLECTMLAIIWMLLMFVMHCLNKEKPSNVPNISV